MIGIVASEEILEAVRAVSHRARNARTTATMTRDESETLIAAGRAAAATARREERDRLERAHHLLDESRRLRNATPPLVHELLKFQHLTHQNAEMPASARRRRSRPAHDDFIASGKCQNKVSARSG